MYSPNLNIFELLRFPFHFYLLDKILMNVKPKSTKRKQKLIETKPMLKGTQHEKGPKLRTTKSNEIEKRNRNYKKKRNLQLTK